MRDSVLSPGDRFLRRDEVERLTGLSRSGIYKRKISDPNFPSAVHLGPNSVAWIESEIRSWMEARVVATRHECAAELVR